MGTFFIYFSTLCKATLFLIADSDWPLHILVRVGKKIMKLPGLVVAKIGNILFYYLLIHQRRAQILNVNIRFTQRNAERTVNFGERKNRIFSFQVFAVIHCSVDSGKEKETGWCLSIDLLGDVSTHNLELGLD